MSAEEVVREAVTEHECRADFTLDSKLSDLDCDSLDLVEILMLIEDKLKKEIDTKSLMDVKTVGDIVKVVEAYC